MWACGPWGGNLVSIGEQGDARAKAELSVMCTALLSLPLPIYRHQIIVFIQLILSLRIKEHSNGLLLLGRGFEYINDEHCPQQKQGK